jgi:signal transduction histidine kinase
VNHIRETHQALIIDDTQVDPHWQMVPDNPALSVTIVPMFGRLDLIGLLILAHEQTGYFKLEHVLLLQAIASQAAIAVENAQLYERMAQEQGRFAAVLQSAADAIMLFDSDTCLAMLNPTAQKLFTDYETKLGLPLARNCGYDKLIDSLENVLSSGKSRTEEILWPDQRIFSASFTHVERGGCVVLLHDVSRFKALERVKDEFIATASHDLKNPITAIGGFSLLLPAAGPLNEQQQDFAERIHHAAENMRELVENMLDIARIDAGIELQPELLDMNHLAAEVAQEFEPQAAAKQQTLQLNPSECAAQVDGDPFQLKQALRNLVGNAIKYTPVNGNVNLSVKTEHYNVQVYIRDNGYGIPAEHLPHIFERFYRVRADAMKEISGNGLGLAIVKSIIERHGGQIKVESKPEIGSCFSFSLPSVPAEMLVPPQLEIEAQSTD